jgi:nickel-dependent lactate racemase
MSVEVPLGEERIEVSIDGSVTVATPSGGTPVDVRERARAAVAEPHGARLSARVDPDDSVGLVVTDITRATPENTLLDVLLAELARGGVSREQVTVVVGLGLHRQMTDAELAAELGEHADLAVNHDPDRVVQVGRVDGCPITLFEPLARADVVCSTGMVEPHQYAGFSGGAKTAVIGAGGESQIRYTHGPELLGREGVRLGRVEDNPFRAFLDRAGDAVGVEFCLHVTHTPAGILGASAGDPRTVVADLATQARDALAVEVCDSYDAVVAGVGAPKDASLYQASRAATYVALGARNPLRAGGRIVVPARLPEGPGQGTGERRFSEWLSDATDPESLYQEMAEGYEPGAQRAFVLARALRNHPVTVTNSSCPELVEECLLDAAPTVEAALDGTDPGDDVLVVPDALHTLLVET